MDKTVIFSENAPKAIGPYSQAIKIDKMIFVSGQLPINPQNGEMPSEIKEQTRQCMYNIENILKSAESSLKNVVKVTIFLKDLSDFSEVNEIYGEFFDQHYPARCCVEVSRLPKDAGIEIEVIATI